MHELMVRSFAYPLEVRDVAGSGERLTVYGRIVPYDEVIEHDNHKPGGPMFRERFIRGALMSVPSYVHRVKLGIEHETGYASNVGRGHEFEDLASGGYMSFRLYRHEAEKAIDHLETTHRGLSVEFYNLTPPTHDGAIVERRYVKLERVAAVEAPAYAGAVVLGIRSQPQRSDQSTEGQGDQGTENAPPEPGQPGARPNLDQALAIRAAMLRDNPCPDGGGQP